MIAATGFRKGWREDPLLADLVTAHELETHDRFLELAPDSTVPALTNERRTLSIAGVAGQWAFPAADTIAGSQVRCPCVHSTRMSYTLTGRIQSRLVATLPPLLVALGIHRWWAVELVVLMLLFGVALDLCIYDRLFEYQPGWLALPLGLVELSLIVLSMRMPVTWPALGLFALGWATAQLCGHALFPRFRLEYAQGGGELGRVGAVAAAAVAAVTFAGLAGAVAVIPPTVHLTVSCAGRS